MAIYTCTTEVGTLSAEQRAVIAAQITRIHSTHTGEPASFVWVIFETVSPDSTFIGGKPAVNALLVGLFREGRRTEGKTQGPNEIWAMCKKGTGLSECQLWGSFAENPGGGA